MRSDSYVTDSVYLWMSDYIQPRSTAGCPTTNGFIFTKRRLTMYGLIPLMDVWPHADSFYCRMSDHERACITYGCLPTYELVLLSDIWPHADSFYSSTCDHKPICSTWGCVTTNELVLLSSVWPHTDSFHFRTSDYTRREFLKNLPDQENRYAFVRFKFRYAFTTSLRAIPNRSVQQNV